MIDAHIAPEMQKTMQAVAAAGGDMTKVNGDSIFPVLEHAEYQVLHHAAAGRSDRSGAESICLRQCMVRQTR